jgi:hypothetical protein
MNRSPRCRAAWALVIAGALAAGGSLSASQDATAPELKAAFLLNFARFTIWPDTALPTGTPLMFCVSGDDRVADAIQELARRQQVQDRAVLVHRVKADVAVMCHLLYSSAGQLDRDQRLLRALAATPVLTVSDSPEFTRAGGIVNFYVDNGKMRFAMNPKAAERAQLKISSKLLNLARIVKDGSNAFDS